MKFAISTILVLTIFAAIQADSPQQSPIAGGYADLDKTDPEASRAARFAVAAAGRRSHTPISLIDLRKAEVQVVAGLNYRLQLSVRTKGKVQGVNAVVYRDLKRRYSLSSWEPARDSTPAPATLEVKVFLIATGDNGKTGKKIGCDDSLVPITRTIKAASAPLRASIEELLALPREYDSRLQNYWFGEKLKVRDVAIRGGVATIRITGQLFVAGVCDEPRIESQIRETARQFPAVKRVRVFVNGQTLAQAIR
jgi:hypothetical protein